ncbi:MAG: N-acetyltransferase [Proteobacteria bacterium]|uniref:GNAT family N-acetyltransferase n=1 Tax=Rudaea sp. TaxID=2136325 RepID=UPI001DACAE6A|nr:N-acetyltransferase [Pseudomonadota bacterium]MBS0566852.1 N-acetyltransferase [Pseudomonadota bacterium]
MIATILRSAGNPDDAAPEWKEKLRDGTSVLIRPIAAGDTAIEREFIERLSPQSRRYRFLGEIATPSRALLDRLTHPDPAHEAAFVALIADGAHKREIGVARYCADRDEHNCECAVVVADEWQGKGLATLLMRHLIEIARQRGYRRLYSIDARDNESMHTLADFLGFERQTDPNDSTQVLHRLDLNTATSG